MSCLTIITGASKGLGKELAFQSLRAGDTVVTMERHPDNALVEVAKKSGCEIVQCPVDLTDLNSTVSTIGWLLRQNEGKDFESIRLINNAGVLGPVGPIYEATPPDIDYVIRINFEAPVLLIQRFLEITLDWPVDRRIMSISSGAARKNVSGWAMYCSTKAALDRFSATVAEDAKTRGLNLRIASVAPGVVDTDMQALIREADERSFPDIQRFKTLKETGQLTSPAEAARKLLNYLDSDIFGNEPISDIRNISLEG